MQCYSPQSFDEKRVGFDVRINRGTGSVSWNDPTHNQAPNVSNCGIIKLGNGPEYSEAVYGTPAIGGKMALLLDLIFRLMIKTKKAKKQLIYN